MPTLNANELALLRQDHKSRIYASFLQPLTLWAAQVNSGALSRADTAIPFNNGTGSHWAAIEAYQEVWVGTSAGTYDVAKLRIKAITSGDAGVTGTLTVQPNNVIWADDMHLTFKHNYPFMAMYPFIDGSEVFYKDTTITYTDENEEPPPVVIANIWPRAQRYRSGVAHIYIEADSSYAIASGATIASYACSVYPSTGVALTFNTSTGVGYAIVTEGSPNYRWFKFTVTDDNGKSQSSWRCAFFHSELPTGPDYPHTDFETGQLTGNWENGGWMMSLTAHDDVDIASIPDDTFAIVWQEREFGNRDKYVINLANATFYNPDVSFRVVAGAPCTITATFHSGVLLNGRPSNGDNFSITLEASGGATDTQAANSSGGSLNVTGFSLAGANCSGTITARYAGAVIRTWTYDRGQVRAWSADPATIVAAYPQELIVGYVRGEKLTFDDGPGAGDDTIEITTIESLLKNEYMFSISLAARPSGIDTWYEYEDWLTIGRACHHIWKWHSTLFEVADVAGLVDNTDLRAYAEFENGTLYTMPDTMARQHGIRAHVVCSKRGWVHLTQDVQLMLDADRAVLSTAATLTEDDYHHLSLSRQTQDRVALVYGSGLKFLGTFSVDDTGENQPDVDPYCALAPGSKPSGMGEGVINFERQVLTSQNQLNQLVGRVYGQANNIYPDIRLDLSGDYLYFVDINWAEFWEIDIAATDTIKGIIEPDLHLIARDITATINGSDIETFVTFEPEAEADIGVTSECPGPPSDLGGAIPVIPTTDGLPGAIVSAGSVQYLPPDTSSWTQRSAKATQDLIQDPFWRTTQASTGSEDAILWRCGVGEIERSDDAGQTWADVTPGTNPPNDAGDTPAPTVGNVTFIMIEGNYLYNQEFVAMANWQNATSDWRSWLAYTDDDGSTWSWKYLGGHTGCSNPGITKYDMTGATNYVMVRAISDNSDSISTCIETDTDTFVIVYYDSTAANLYVQAFSINPSTRAITWGTRVLIPNASANNSTISRVGDNKFVVTFFDSSTSTRKTVIGTVTGTTISLGTPANIPTATEVSNGLFFTRGQVISPDGTNAVLICVARVLNNSCTLRAQYGLYVLSGTISGTTITWSDSTCNGNTVRAWTQIEYDFGWPTNNAADFKIIPQGSSHWIAMYEHRDDDELYIRAGTGTSFGSAVGISRATGLVTAITYPALVPLDTSRCVVVYGLTNLYGNVVERTGTAVAIGGYVKIANGSGIQDILDIDPIVISDTAFAVNCWGPDPVFGVDCFSVFRCSVISNNITLEDSCVKYRHETSSPADLNVGWSDTYFINIADSDYSDVSDPYATTYQHTPFDCIGTGDCKGAGLSIGKGSGAVAWATVGDDTNLELLAVLLPGLSIVNRYSLGAATWAQMAANTYIARPFALFGDDSEVYIAGRMNAPQGLANPEHVIGTANGGASFASIENGWSTDWCGCMYVTPGGVIVAIRNNGSTSKLYIGDALGLDLKSTTILAASVNWKAIALDFLDASIILGNDSGGTYMVVITVPPYLDWWDLTSDHPTGSGINALEIL